MSNFWFPFTHGSTYCHILCVRARLFATYWCCVHTFGVCMIFERNLDGAMKMQEGNHSLFSDFFFYFFFLSFCIFIVKRIFIIIFQSCAVNWYSTATLYVAWAWVLSIVKIRNMFDAWYYLIQSDSIQFASHWNFYLDPIRSVYKCCYV